MTNATLAEIMLQLAVRRSLINPSCLLRTIRSLSSSNPPNIVYLHIGPSGDCWTGDSIFAAKHLQPDYVKSIPLCTGIMSEDDIMDILQEDVQLQQQVYDQGRLDYAALKQRLDARREQED